MERLRGLLDCLFEEMARRRELAGWLVENWKLALATAAGVFVGGKWIRGTIKRQQARRKIARRQDLVRQQRQELRSRLTAGGNGELVTAARRAILELDVGELADRLRSDALTPLEVLEAYQARALEATEAKNCVCLFLDGARELAAGLASVPAVRRGPLHGVPISVKECFQVEGQDMTVGMSRFLNQPAAEDGPFVKHLKDLGAVPFCLTNLPQTMKSFGCSNPIYGSTLHPVDDERSPGGSSGGEGCLLAMGGSVLGIGTDVGGSLRTPASFCGVVGIKPTTARIYCGGRRQGSKGYVVGVCSNAGFMSRTVDGVTLGMRSLLQDPMRMAREDHRVAPIQWRDQMHEPGRKLRVGYFEDLNYVEPTPGMRRIVREAAEALEADGHEVVKFEFAGFDRADHYYFSHILADEGANSLEWLDGDVIDQSISMNMLVWSMSRRVKKFVMGTLGGMVSPTSSRCSVKGHYMTRDLWTSQEELVRLTADVLKEWDRLELDVVISPPFGFPAPFEADPPRMLPAVAIPGAYNVMDMPAGVVPFGVETKEDTEALEHYPTRVKGFDLMYTLIKKATRGAVGLPIGLQVAGRPYQEEMVLHAMKVVERLRQKRDDEES